MCTGCYPDDIIVCPSCKRDDEGFKLGESDSPFMELGDGKLQCLCGRIFPLEEQAVRHVNNMV